MLVSLVLAGCATSEYVPDNRAISAREARKAATEICAGLSLYRRSCATCGPHDEVRSCRTSFDRLELVGAKNPSYSIALRDVSPRVECFGGGRDNCRLALTREWGLYRLYGGGVEWGNRLIRLADALSALQRAAAAEESGSEAAVFDQQARAYREAKVKPQITEDARRFRVQAEAALRDKRFEDAADYYRDALARAPWWPDGRFNRALVLGEIGDFRGAILEMKRYLALVPDAPDARAARDRIYEWEARSSRP